MTNEDSGSACQSACQTDTFKEAGQVVRLGEEARVHNGPDHRISRSQCGANCHTGQSGRVSFSCRHRAGTTHAVRHLDQVWPFPRRVSGVNPIFGVDFRRIPGDYAEQASSGRGSARGNHGLFGYRRTSARRRQIQTGAVSMFSSRQSDASSQDSRTLAVAGKLHTERVANESALAATGYSARAAHGRPTCLTLSARSCGLTSAVALCRERTRRPRHPTREPRVACSLRRK